MKNMKLIKQPTVVSSGGPDVQEVYASADKLQSTRFEAITHGYLPAGKTFDWHELKGTEEVMIVLSGKGEVVDEDGTHEYQAGDVFVFRPDTHRKITNTSQDGHEMVFVRIKI